MGDDLTLILNEIATLLRRQIEQHDAMIHRTEEMRTKMIEQSPHLQEIRQRVEENREKWQRAHVRQGRRDGKERASVRPKCTKRTSSSKNASSLNWNGTTARSNLSSRGFYAERGCAGLDA